MIKNLDYFRFGQQMFMEEGSLLRVEEPRQSQFTVMAAAGSAAVEALLED